MEQAQANDDVLAWDSAVQEKRTPHARLRTSVCTLYSTYKVQYIAVRVVH
jgi:hypothetical protein